MASTIRFTAEHEWLRLEEDGSITVGITEHAQDAEREESGAETSRLRDPRGDNRHLHGQDRNADREQDERGGIRVLGRR